MFDKISVCGTEKRLHQSLQNAVRMPNRQLDGHMPCYNTDSFHLSHIQKGTNSPEVE